MDRLALLGCAAAIMAPALADGGPKGADVFAARCAVCHGPKAEGVPGSFPPLGAQIQAFAQSPAGRDYLVMVVSSGLIGSVSVAGATYQGAMPPQSMLSEVEVAAVLNYLASGLGKNSVVAHPFDAPEIAAIRTRHLGITGPTVIGLRPASPNK
jgi:mono/diheme cytochrome c family protein